MEDALRAAAAAWLAEHGAPPSASTSGNGFVTEAERVFWRTVAAE